MLGRASWLLEKPGEAGLWLSPRWSTVTASVPVRPRAGSCPPRDSGEPPTQGPDPRPDAGSQQRGLEKPSGLAPAATAELGTTRSSGRGFAIFLAVRDYLCSGFNVGETSFLDTTFYSVPPRRGVFRQKTLLSQPLALQFTLSTRDTTLLNQNLTMVSFCLPPGKCFHRYTDQ